MLPPSFALPFAILLVLGGALSCFAGYRLFRIILGIYGFILGAMIASSMMGVTNTVGMIVAAIVGGLAGALILVFAYFIGIALVGAGLGTLIAHVIWTQVRTVDPPWQLVVFAAFAGAIGAMVLQRYVIIVSTAFAGAWTLIVGGVAVAGGRGAARAASAAPAPDAWILYPFTPAPGSRWVIVAWIVLGLAGLAVQLGVTAKKK